MQILKALREVAALVVVDGQGGIARTNLGVINSQKSLLQHDCFRLQLNCLQLVTELVLDAGDSRYAIGDIFAHVAADLE